MNLIYSPKFWRGINNARKIRYICICIFAVIFFIIAIGGYFESQRDVGTFIDLSKGRTAKIDKYAYINANSEPFLFAENDTSKLYFIWDTNGQLYIVDLTNNLLKKLEEATEPIRLTGTTKEITRSIRSIAMSAYTKAKDDDMEKMTSANFNNILGTVYLEARQDLTNAAVFYGISCIFLAFALALFIAHLFMERKIKRVINKLTPEELSLISLEIENEKTVVYEKINLFLTENYVISMGNSLDIIKYDDIRWVYFTDIKQNGILSARRVDIFTKDQKNHWIPFNPYGKGKNLHLTVIEEIGAKREDILVGFTDENKKLMKEEKKDQKKKPKN